MGKIQYDGGLDKLELITLVIGYLKNKEMIGDNWYPTASTRNLKYFLAYASKHKVREHKLDLVG